MVREPLRPSMELCWHGVGGRRNAAVATGGGSVHWVGRLPLGAAVSIF